MGIVKEKPADLKPKNDLDNIPDELLPHPATIRLGNRDLLVMDEPPQPGDFVKLELTLQHKGGGYDIVGEGDKVYHCKMRFVAAKVTVTPYKPEAEAPPPGLLDEAMNVNPDACPNDSDTDADADPEGDTGGGTNGYGPGFSHTKTDD